MTETGAQRFEAAWREACTNHENVAEAIGRLLDEQGVRLARVEALADEWDRLTERRPFAAGMDHALARLRAALAPEAEGATS